MMVAVAAGADDIPGFRSSVLGDIGKVRFHALHDVHVSRELKMSFDSL